MIRVLNDGYVVCKYCGWSMVTYGQVLETASINYTFAIIGAILGFPLAYGGRDSVKWDGVWKIMLSWIISPVLAGVFALIFYLSLKQFVLNKDDAVERTLRLFLILTLFTFMINTFLSFIKEFAIRFR